MPAQLQQAMSRSADCSKVIRSLPPRTLSCPPSNFHTEDQPLYIESGRSIPHGISLSAFLYPCSSSITERFLTLCFRGGKKQAVCGAHPFRAAFQGISPRRKTLAPLEMCIAFLQCASASLEMCIAFLQCGFATLGMGIAAIAKHFREVRKSPFICSE